MEETVGSLARKLAKVRTGRASPSVLDGVTVDYYGAPTPVAQVGQISTPESRLLQIQPFDRTMIGAIEAAIIGANLGVTPSNDGNLIRVPFPAPTEERRRLKVREIRKIGEDAKIALRNSRRDGNEAVRKSEKDKSISKDDARRFQERIQETTDAFIGRVDAVIASKEKELLEV